MTNRIKRFFVFTLLGSLGMSIAHAAILATGNKFASGSPPSVSGTDLGETAALSYSATGPTDTFGTLHVSSPGEVEQLFNANVGNTDNDSNDTGETTVRNTNSFTVNFDISTNTLGYDITEIFSVAGWSTIGAGRSNQGYQIDLTFVDNTTETLIDGTWETNSPAEYWTTATLTNIGGGVLTEGTVSATGVRAITFLNFDPSNAGGGGNFVSYREFDIIGTATIPEPSTLALFGLAGLAVLVSRKRLR